MPDQTAQKISENPGHLHCFNGDFTKPQTHHFFVFKRNLYKTSWVTPLLYIYRLTFDSIFKIGFGWIFSPPGAKGYLGPVVRKLVEFNQKLGETLN